MYIVIVGAGKVGAYLARDLQNGGHEICIIESDLNKIRPAIDISGLEDSAIVRGDGSESSVMAEAGVKRADIFITTTGHDEDNLASCQLAKNIFGVKRTISLINDPENEIVFNMLGVDVAVRRTKLLLDQIESILDSRTDARFFSLNGDYEVVEMHIPQTAAIVGGTISGILLPHETTIICIIGSDGKRKSIEPETRIEIHDAITALTRSDQAEALLEFLISEG
jgi:trk system potassium uptake protein TrkA